MPQYLYGCRSCNYEFEIQQSMNDDPISLCPKCNQNSVRRLITQTGIIFKGAGFYTNDKNSSTSSESSHKKNLCNSPDCKKQNPAQEVSS